MFEKLVFFARKIAGIFLDIINSNYQSYNINVPINFHFILIDGFTSFSAFYCRKNGKLINFFFNKIENYVEA
jgi:hypothetical protein